MVTTVQDQWKDICEVKCFLSFGWNERIYEGWTFYHSGANESIFERWTFSQVLVEIKGYLRAELFVQLNIKVIFNHQMTEG